MKRNFFLNLYAAGMSVLLLGGLLLPAFSPLLAQDTGVGSTIVTVEPKHGDEPVQPVPASAVKLKLNGKNAEVAAWNAYTANATQPNLQLVLLIDDGARSGLGLQLQDLAKFITQQPPTTEVAVAYMRNGTAQLTGPFTTDHAKAAQTLRLPLSAAGTNGSPYFSLGVARVQSGGAPRSGDDHGRNRPL
jgi:hypothetical protein